MNKLFVRILFPLIVSGHVLAQSASWELAQNMPTPREKLSTCVSGHHIYAFGGYTSASVPAMATVERLNTNTGNWSPQPAMPTARGSMATSRVDGICYLIGGRLQFQQAGYTTVEAFNPNTGNWSTRAPMPTGRFYPASAVLNGMIYVAGGAADDATPVDAFEAYDPASNSWQTLPPLPFPRALAAAVALDGKIFVLGGTTGPTGREFDDVDVFDPATNTWSSVAPLPAVRAGFAAVLVNGKIFAYGGAVRRFGQSSLFIYDPASDSWSDGPELLDNRTRFGAALVNGRLYAIGGARSSTPPHPGVSSVEILEVDGLATGFQINAGLNDAWLNLATTGQGFFISVFPDIESIFLAWFTYDTERPAGDVMTNLGEPGHRWLTAFGPYVDNAAVLDIEVTAGGVFDSMTPTPTQMTDGEIVLEFENCNSGSVSYDIVSLDLQGVIPITRIATDNVALCEALDGEASLR